MKEFQKFLVQCGSKYFVAHIFFLFILVGNMHAICPGGQTNVKIIIQPDNIGSETTWQLKNALTQAILNSGGPYIDGNTVPIVITNCVDNGVMTTFVIHDSYGDGICCLQGTGFYVVIIGTDTIAKNGTFNFSDSVSFLTPPVALDASVLSVDLPEYIDTSGSQIISGILANKGTSTITNLVLNYQIDNGTIVPQSLSGLSIPKFKNYQYTFSSTWNATLTGGQVVKVWASLINSLPDQNTQNDSISKNVYVAERLPKRKVLFEDFTSTTDTVNEFQELILDSLVSHNHKNVIAVRYHLGIPTPGNDPMYLFNSGDNDNRKTYYSVSNVPQVVMDGNAFNGLPGALSQAMVSADTLKKGLFDIILDESISGTDISISVKSVALVPLPSTNTKLFVMICEDPVHFSTPPAPSLKNNFNFVMRAILPNTSGFSLGLPVPGQSDSADFVYHINTSVIDASKLRTIIFIQDMSSKEIYQVLNGETTSGYNHASTITSLVSVPVSKLDRIKIFPNPLRETLNFSFYDFDNGEVSLFIYDLLGEEYLRIPSIRIEEGNQLYSMGLGFLPPGIYFVKILSNTGSCVNKIIIE